MVFLMIQFCLFRIGMCMVSFLFLNYELLYSELRVCTCFQFLVCGYELRRSRKLSRFQNIIAVHRQNVPRQNVPRQNVPRQNVPRDKTSQDKTSQGTKRPKGQNVPRDKTSQGKKILHFNFQFFKNWPCWIR